MSSKIKVDTIENVAGSGNVSLGSGHNLVVPGNITGQGTAAITSNATVGGTLGVTGNTTMGGTAAITGNTTVGGTLVNTGLITASAGVAIGGTGSANTLDDYEEGVWTPVASTNAGTLSNESGVYVKIGRVVFIVCFISFTGASTSANRTYSGLPFTVSDTFPYTSVDYHGTSWSSHYGRVLFQGGTTTVVDNYGAVTAGSFGANNSVRIQGFYLTD